MFELLSMKNQAKRMNDIVFSDYYYRLMLIARSLFEWHDLPNWIDEKWIERYLYNEGGCLFYKDPIVGFMVAKMSAAGPLNYYNEPTTVMPIANNYVYTGEQLINNDNCVIIRNNDDMIPTANTIKLYAYRLATIERTIDANIQQQKTPLIVKCSDKQRLTLKNVIAQRNENEPVIWGDKNLDISGVEVLNTTAPIVFDKLEIQKHMVYNECMTFLGINNANMDKRERLVDDEVQANNEQVQANEDVMLKARKLACERINEIFGLNISVERRMHQEPIMEVSEGFEGVMV